MMNRFPRPLLKAHTPMHTLFVHGHETEAKDILRKNNQAGVRVLHKVLHVNDRKTDTTLLAERWG